MDKQFEKLNEAIQAEAKTKVAAGQDLGHEKLILNLTELLEEAKRYEFHDYLNENYSAPKLALVDVLDKLKEKVINGDYDN